MAEALALHKTSAGPSGASARPRLRLDGALAKLALSSPAAIAFHDQPGREAWSGLPPRAISFTEANGEVDRLAGLLTGLRLAAHANVGIMLPHGTEACLSILACQRAGLRPCLMSSAWSREEVVGAVAAVGAEAVITQTRVGDLGPAALLCEVAASFFGLRFLCAFGPDAPDGVIALDPILAEGAAGGMAARPGHSTIATFDRVAGRLLAVWRESDALVSAALPVVLATRMSPSACIVSLVAPDTLAGLATGLAAAIVSGAALHMHGVFDSAALLCDLDGEAPVHLVAPAWLEPMLRDAKVIDRLASLVLVHRPPVSLAKAPPTTTPVVDVVALGETALVAVLRDTSGFPAVGHEAASPQQEAASFTEMRVTPAGIIEVRGGAVADNSLDALTRPGPASRNADGWLTTRFAATLTGRRITAVHDTLAA